jgi:hypothetical protein
MKTLLKLVLEHPEAFEATALPCCLRGFLSNDDQFLDVRRPHISRSPPLRLYVDSREFEPRHHSYKPSGNTPLP